MDKTTNTQWGDVDDESLRRGDANEENREKTTGGSTHMGLRVEHILETVLYASDIDAARTFYSQVMGLAEYSHAADRFVFFQLDQSMLLVFNPYRSIVQTGDEAAPIHGALGPGHVAFRVEHDDELKEWESHLERHGVSIERRIDWPVGGQSLYFRDPAGNSVELATARLWFRQDDEVRSLA